MMGALRFYALPISSLHLDFFFSLNATSANATIYRPLHCTSALLSYIELLNFFLRSGQ